ncbi:hypothetical protein CK203_109230 [Vitis vinifera]|uniref:Uncharacterized protein n=1 Tax=Vitis vinifera TaxID=29760 RepID=A0A438C594_VITVI|nr:hypothetical protein CK203_109230 [Vitis vinifera]
MELEDRWAQWLGGFKPALKPPLGAATIGRGLAGGVPREGWRERSGSRRWVPQPSILSHWESLMSDPR